ncbi:hypothetical protein PHPALM_29068 [Phytophthora palmivora]|uniref:Uncharacterized protein n=1 Tax=Phytophthora palmivora TaxID=4796 RepID=A0A2P4X8I4_9STRA|nr:hypothetical protein PHPALM_29068 [Phytophthora palmivora]
MLRSRPTRRELLTSQLEVERLQRHVQKYLKEKLHCYLSLDLATSESKMKNLTETNMLERVGQICSDIVASCCYILEVEVVGELPNCVRKAQQLSQVSTLYQGFVERIEKLLKRFDKVCDLYLC